MSRHRACLQVLSPEAVYQKAYGIGWKQPQPCVYRNYQRVAGIQQYSRSPAAQGQVQKPLRAWLEHVLEQEDTSQKYDTIKNEALGNLSLQQQLRVPTVGTVMRSGTSQRQVVPKFAFHAQKKRGTGAVTASLSAQPT